MTPIYHKKKLIWIYSMGGANMEIAKNAMKYGKGVLIGYLIAIISLVVYAALLAYTSVSEEGMPVCVTVIQMFSVLMASLSVTSHMRKQGLKTGVLVAILYMVPITFMSYLHRGGNFSIKFLIFVLYMLLMGAIGGIVGVNFFQNRKE